MATKEDRFPPIPALDTLPFMHADLAKFMATRAEQIDHITGLMGSAMNELPDFANVSEDVKQYFARRMATFSEGLFERGYHGGLEDGREERDAEIREAHLYKMRTTGNHN